MSTTPSTSATLSSVRLRHATERLPHMVDTLVGPHTCVPYGVDRIDVESMETGVVVPFFAADKALYANAFAARRFMGRKPDGAGLVLYLIERGFNISDARWLDDRTMITYVDKEQP